MGSLINTGWGTIKFIFSAGHKRNALCLISGKFTCLFIKDNFGLFAGDANMIFILRYGQWFLHNRFLVCQINTCSNRNLTAV